MRSLVSFRLWVCLFVCLQPLLRKTGKQVLLGLHDGLGAAFILGKVVKRSVPEYPASTPAGPCTITPYILGNAPAKKPRVPLE